ALTGLTPRGRQHPAPVFHPTDPNTDPGLSQNGTSGKDGLGRAPARKNSSPDPSGQGTQPPPAPNASAPCSQLVTEPACDLTHEGFGLGLNQGRDPGLCQRGDREQLSVRMLHDADFVPQIQ